MQNINFKLSVEWLNNLNFESDIRHVDEKHIIKALREVEWMHTNDKLLKWLSSNDNKPFLKYINAKRQNSIAVAAKFDEGTIRTSSPAKARMLNEQFQSAPLPWEEINIRIYHGCQLTCRARTNDLRLFQK